MEKGKMYTPLVMVPEHMEKPGCAEDEGDNTPSVWGKGGKSFKVGMSNEGSTGMSIPESVSLSSGMVMGDGKPAKG